VDGELQVVYQFVGEGLRTEDEIGIEIGGPLAAAAAARVVTESGEQATDFSDLSAPVVRRFIWYDGDAAYTLRYPFPLALAGGRRAGVLRLVQLAGIGRARTDPTDASHPGVYAALGFGLKVTLQRELGSLDQALERGQEAERLDQLSEALAVYRRVADTAKDKETTRAREATQRIREIETRVQGELDRARHAVLAARLLGSAETLASAHRQLDTLARRFKESPWMTDVQQMEGELEEIRKSIVPAGDLGAQIFRLAEHHFNRGEFTLCRLFLDYFDKAGKQSALAGEAAELRDRLQAAPPVPGAVPGSGTPGGAPKSRPPEGPKGG
jgi:hypothetical protein